MNISEQERSQPSYTQLTDSKGKKNGIYIPVDDYKNTTRCTTCSVVISHKPTIKNKIHTCLSCKIQQKNKTKE